jgi:hypothetical protein
MSTGGFRTPPARNFSLACAVFSINKLGISIIPTVAIGFGSGLPAKTDFSQWNAFFDQDLNVLASRFRNQSFESFLEIAGYNHFPGRFHP